MPSKVQLVQTDVFKNAAAAAVVKDAHKFTAMGIFRFLCKKTTIETAAPRRRCTGL